MTCDDVTRRLTAYVDGELDDASGSAMRGHLRTCAACRAAADDELAVRDAMARLPTPDVPPTLWDGISARLAEREVADSKRSRWWLWWQGARPKLIPATLVAATATLAIAMWIRRDRGEDTTPAPAVAAPVIDRAPVIADPPATPTVKGDCDLRAAGPTGLSAAIDRCYTAATEELLAMVGEDRPAWTEQRAARFDADLAAAREDIARAAPGRPRERAWQAVIQLLQRAVAVPVVAEVSP